MALVNRSFSVNVTPGMMPPIVHVSEYDVGRAYTVSILDEQGNTFTIPSGTTASIEGTLNGSVGFTQNATISNNQVSFTLTESMTAYSGKAWCKIKLTQNSQPIQTCAFVLAVDRAGVEAGTITGASGFEEQIQEAVEDWAEQQGFTSPTVDITPIEGGHRVTFTDVDGSESMDVMNGRDGEGGDVDFDKLTFGQSSGKQNIHFAANAPVSSGAYGELGRVIECKAGDTVYMNGTMRSNSTAKILSAVPSGQYGAIANQIGTLEQTADNTYTIPTNLSSAVCVYFPCWFGYFSTEKYQALDNGVIEEDSIITGSYTASNICPMVSHIPFSTVPAYVQQQNVESFWVSSDYNKAMYASLFAAVSDLVNAKVAIMGDSLTEQSAGATSTNASVTGYRIADMSGYGWASRFARKYMMSGIIHGVGQQWWYSTSARPNGGTAAVRKLIDSNYVPNYIILEYGTNDILSGSLGTYEDTASETATATAGAMRWCIETLQSTYPSAKILVVMPCLHSGTNGLPPAAQATYYALANQILDDYAIKRVDMAHESGIVKAMGNSDGIHLALQDGYAYNNNTPAVEKYSRAIEKALLSL